MFPFPKVTYDFEEFLKFHEGEKEEFLELLDIKEGVASSAGIIWIKKPSIKLLIHELLHYIHWKFHLPFCFNKMIHNIF